MPADKTVVIPCTHPEPAFYHALRFWPIMCTRREAAPGHRFAFRAYWDSTALCLDGSLLLESPAGQHRVRKGDLMFFTKDRHYAFQAHPDSPFTTIGISYLCEASWIGPHLGFVGDDCHRRLAPAPALRACFEDFHAHYRAPIAEPLSTFERAFTLLAACARTRRAVPPDVPSTPADLVRRALRLMELSLAESSPLPRVCARLGVTPRTLLRAFRASRDQTPGEALEDLRIQRVKTLLAVPGLKLGWIATECGYRGESRFFRVFKRRVGVTPARWRETVSHD